jgi:hypothetical protein
MMCTHRLRTSPLRSVMMMVSGTKEKTVIATMPAAQGCSHKGQRRGMLVQESLSDMGVLATVGMFAVCAMLYGRKGQVR